MIMRRAVITVVTLSIAFSSMATAEAEPNQSAETAEIKTQGSNDSGIKVGMTAVATRLIQEYVTPTLCSYSPSFCAKHQLQTSRGIQSYLATAGTMFAGVLGVILVKIKILIVLSLITTVIGKLLLFYAFLKSDHYHHGHYHHGHHHHGHHAPFVKYTKDKYYIKNTPAEHSHDVIVDSPSHHTPYHAHSPASSGGVSYYKRR